MTTTAEQRQTVVLDLATLNAAMLSDVGGKAANLGELIRAGLPVPAGFCVTTRGYRQAVAGTELDTVLDDLAHADPADVPALTALAGRARAQLIAARMPDPVADAIAEAYDALGEDVPVAVRSSATAEDLPSASFAGQQDTYLNVVGRAAVLAAVVHCWASLWTDRAVVYRASQGIDHRGVHLAVVIQRMVDSQVAGVLFSADPVTGRRRRAVVDASPGLGEAVVSGAVNPDHFVVDTDTGEVLDRRLGDKRIAVRSRPGGGTEQVARSADVTTAAITDDQLRALAALGDRVEAHYGVPQDIEWAIDADGTIWLTQARPITTLFPLPPTAPPPGEPPRVYFCFSVAQGLYRPLTPAGLAALRLFGSGAAGELGIPVADPLAGPPVYAEIGQRVFADLTTVLRSRVGRALVPRVFDVMETRSAAVMRSLFTDPRFAVTQRSVRPFARRVLRVARRNDLPRRVMRALARPDQTVRDLERIPGRIRQQLALPPGAPAEQRLDRVQRALGTEVFPLAPRIASAAAAGFAMLWLAGRLLGDRLRPGDLQTVLRGLPNNVTTQMDLALWQASRTVRGDAAATALVLDTPVDDLAQRWRAGTLPPVLRAALDGFLERYGERAVAEIDAGMPRWSEDPRHVLGVLANYLRLDDDRAAPDAVFARAADAAGAMSADLVARSGAMRRPLVRFALDRGRRLAGVRELPKYAIVVCLAQVRGHMRAIGAELAATGVIDAPDDVFFLDLAEMRTGLGGTDHRGLVQSRRAAYDTELRRKHVPRVLLSDGTEPENTMVSAAPSDGSLSGTPASAGTVTAVARVVLEPVGAHLEPGEILVAPSTDPGWTPLFLTAGGLVMEMGGPNSHGAVVAREYGIPAVVGVADATTRITTGDEVTVDGAAGIVRMTC
jgi:pyruvate,water dikinase